MTNQFLTTIIVSITGIVVGCFGSGDGFLRDHFDVLESLGAVCPTLALQTPRRSFTLTLEQYVDEVRHLPRCHHDVGRGLRCWRCGAEIVLDLSDE